jgi:1-deoxy-D-xylulose-5-phosphate reductoisomerase
MTDTIKRNIAILGSTGSIGQQTLDIVRNFPDKFTVTGLAGGENVDVLNEQIREFKPELIYSLNKISPPDDCKVTSMEDIATHPQVDLVIIATSGKANRSGKQGNTCYGGQNSTRRSSKARDNDSSC